MTHSSVSATGCSKANARTLLAVGGTLRVYYFRLPVSEEALYLTGTLYFISPLSVYPFSAAVGL